MNSKTKYAVLMLILFAALPLLAHQGHHKKPQTQTNAATESTVQTTQTTSGVTEEHHASESNNVSNEQQERDPKTIMREAMWSHMHNKIIHFPLALGVTASVLMLFARKRTEMLPVIRILLIIAALFAVAAYFTGKAQEEPFEEGEMHEFVEWHQWFGIASGVCLFAGIFVSRKTTNLLIPYALTQLLLLAVTGFLGGILAHG
jgi:uncharacterized membrane protein